MAESQAERPADRRPREIKVGAASRYLAAAFEAYKREVEARASRQGVDLTDPEALARLSASVLEEVFCDQVNHG